MRKRILMTLAMSLLSVPAMAQYDYAGEVFAGYSLLNVKPGEGADNAWLKRGWNGSVTGWVNDWFGMTADFTGNYGKIEVPANAVGVTEVDGKQHGFLAGPSLRFQRREKFTSSFRVLFGGARATVLADSAALHSTQFAYALGGAFDYNITDRIAWRIIQPNAYFTSFGNHTQKNFRVSTGLVIRFGEN